MFFKNLIVTFEDNNKFKVIIIQISRVYNLFSIDFILLIKVIKEHKDI